MKFHLIDEPSRPDFSRFIDDSRTRRIWGIFWFSLVIFYFGSVVYGLVWSGPYSVAIYFMHFGGRLLRRVPWILLALAAISAIPFVLLRSAALRARVRASSLRIWNHAQQWIPILLLGLVVAGAIRVGVLAFTDHFKGNAWYDQTWGMSHAGFAAVLRSALLVAAENLGPALVVLLPFALWKPGDSAPRVLLTFMVIVIIGYTAVLQWFLPYQYYYARYLLSELIPFSTLVIALRCADWWRNANLRPWITGALVTTGVYFVWFSWPLIGFREASGAESSLSRIASQLDRGSVLLVDETSIPNPFRFVTPLRMWFGKSVYNVRDASQIPAIALDVKRAGFNEVLLLTSGNNVPTPFVFEMKAHFEQTVMEHSPLIPRRAVDMDATDFVLSRLDDASFAALALTSADGLNVRDLARGCCTGFVLNDVWTEERASIRGLTLPKGAWRRLIVTMHGYRPDYAQSGLVVRVDGKELRRDRFDGRTFEFSLGSLDGPTPFDIDLTTRTFVPRDLGLNDDTRLLGVDIATLRVE